jgi:hypothetical protein
MGGTQSSFEYEPLKGPTMIRLIKVRPNRINRLIDVAMFPVDLPHRPQISMKKVPRYKCLSYTWGEPPEDHKILVNGKVFQVRKNLFEFLELATELYPNEPLWIDALCISQIHNKEKSHQVQRMGAIYENATEVIIWLGKGLTDERRWAQKRLRTLLRARILARQIASSPIKRFPIARAVQACKRILARSFICGRRLGYRRLQPSKPSKLGDGMLQLSEKYSTEYILRAICKHPYWTRAWIAQEILLQDNIKILVGRAWIEWDRFGQVLQALQEHGYQSVRGLPTPLAKDLFLAWSATRRLHHHRHDFWLYMKLRSRSECVDIRDKIYSLLAISSSPFRFERLVVNYDEERECLFWRVFHTYRAWRRDSYIYLLMDVLNLSTEALDEWLIKNPDPKLVIPRGLAKRWIHCWRKDPPNPSTDIGLLLT